MVKSGASLGSSTRDDLAAKGHIARSIALTLQQHHMDSPNLQTALLAEADRQVSQIECVIRSGTKTGRASEEPRPKGQ